MKRWQWGLVLAGCAALAGVLAVLASPLPDGLDTTIERLGLPVGHSAHAAPLPEYATPGVGNQRASTALAAGAGLLVVFIVTYALGRLVSRRTRTISPPAAGPGGAADGHQEGSP